MPQIAYPSCFSSSVRDGAMVLSSLAPETSGSSACLPLPSSFGGPPFCSLFLGFETLQPSLERVRPPPSSSLQTWPLRSRCDEGNWAAFPDGVGASPTAAGVGASSRARRSLFWLANSNTQSPKW
eukprot:scaffold97321_cov32-Tisochrysis_lutea.AAC.3